MAKAWPPPFGKKPKGKPAKGKKKPPMKGKSKPMDMFDGPKK